MLIATALALLVATPAEDFLRTTLAPCGFGGKDIEPEAIYEPTLAALARRVAELAPDTHPEYHDSDIRSCGSAPAKPVNSVKTVKSDSARTTLVVDSGTVDMNNRGKQTYVVVQTASGPRVDDAIYKRSTLRAELEKRLRELLVVEGERSTAVSFIRRLLEEGAKPGEDVFSPGLQGAVLPKAKTKKVVAGLNQQHSTDVTAELADGTSRFFIVEATAAGPRIWDVYDSQSQRVAVADKATDSEAQQMTDDEAVAYIRSELQQFIKATKGHKETISRGLATLMEIDGKLTDGVPYVNGNIVCGCQDYEKFSIQSVKTDGRDGAKVRVVADFRVFPGADHARHQTFIVVKTKRGPEIYDVQAEDGSLRAALVKSIAQGYGAR